MALDPKMEAEARQWIEEMLGDPSVFASAGFEGALKDGRLLCNVANAIKPGILPPPAESKMAFKQSDRQRGSNPRPTNDARPVT
eukprot:6576151-Prymnesium_polylepis.2